MRMETNKSLQFTVELKGIDLPDHLKQEISQEINRLVLKKLGSIDLAARAVPAKSVLGLIDLINGGRIAKISLAQFENVNTQVARVFELPDTGIVQVSQGY